MENDLDAKERAGDVSVIVPAAGLGLRMGADIRKPFLKLGGESILFRACRRLARLDGVFEVIVAAHPDDLAYIRDDIWEEAAEAGVTLAVEGGKFRAETVWNALQVVSARAELVAVHDAVRPFFSADMAKALFSTARRRGAAVPVVPMRDTPKRVEGDIVIATPRRTGMMRAQTPQVFQSDLLIEAFEYAIRTGGLSESVTDDSLLVEAMGREVAAVLGDEFNIKITEPADLKIADAFMSAGLVDNS